MFPYILVYIVSFSLMWLSNYFEGKNNYLATMFVLTSLLILAAFAGIADIDVGADKITYANEIFYEANYINSFTDFIYMNSGVEIGYLIFNRIVAFFISSIHWYYFIYTFFVCSIFYLCVRLYKNYVSIPFVWLIFLTTLYPLLLCLFRQGIAISLISLAISLQIIKNKSIVPMSLIILGMLFHSSGIIGFVFFGLVYLLKKDRFSLTKQAILLIIVIVIMFRAITILPMLTRIGLLSSKYNDYVDGFLGVDSSATIGVSALFLLIGLFYLKEIKTNKVFSIVYFFSIINTFIYPLEQISAVIGRLGLYFKIFLAIYYGFLVQQKFFNTRINIKKTTVGFLIVVYIITANNGFIFGLPNQAGVGTFDIFPYKSSIIENLISR